MTVGRVPAHSARRMPPHPRPQYALDPIDSTEPPLPASRPAARAAGTGSSDDARPDAIWVRVGTPDRDPDESAGDPDPTSVSVADVESALDGLGAEVEALGTDAAGDDLQRVVDHYERLIADRDRTIRDRRTSGTRAPGGPAAAVRSRLAAIADRLRR